MKGFEVGQIIAKAWSDQAFQSRLLANPNEALKECMIEIPIDMDLKVHLNSERVFHLVVPLPPVERELATVDDASAEDRGGCRLPCRGDNSW